MQLIIKGTHNIVNAQDLKPCRRHLSRNYFFKLACIYVYLRFSPPHKSSNLVPEKCLSFNYYELGINFCNFNIRFHFHFNFNISHCSVFCLLLIICSSHLAMFQYSRLRHIRYLIFNSFATISRFPLLVLKCSTFP